MNKILIAGFAAIVFALTVPLTLQSVPGSYPSAMAEEAADHVSQMRLTLKKLTDAMASMNDFDELEKAGMPKASVDRMRSAMQMKINQMMDEVIQEIHKL